MATVTVNDASLTAIADAIREKLDVETTYLPSQMAAAIESIATGSSLSSADEGKVVVESGGSYVLAAQNSRTVTRNGTYDTTTNDEVIVSVSGGGGSTNILSGTHAPTASDGSDGDVYISYVPEGVRNSIGQYINTDYSGDSTSKYVIDFMFAASQVRQYPTPFGGRSQSGSVTDASNVHVQSTSTIVAWGSSQATAFNVGYSSAVGKLSHIELDAGTVLMRVGADEYRYTFSPTSINATTSIGIFALLANNSTINTCMANDMVLYSFEIYENDTLVHRFVPAVDDNDTVCVYDEVANEYKYHSGGGTLTHVDGGTIIDVYLKVNGAWVPIEGQDIDDVNLGS